MVRFEPYRRRHRQACLAIFDENCPRFFAPNEREDYAGFLDREHPDYRIGMVEGHIVGAFGLCPGQCDGEAHLNWILLSPSVQGRGLGRAIMAEVARHAQARRVSRILIAASHLSASFFARFGARELRRTDHGWGPDMHRIDMVWELDLPFVDTAPPHGTRA